jgi:hypothetical protein
MVQCSRSTTAKRTGKCVEPDQTLGRRPSGASSRSVHDRGSVTCPLTPPGQTNTVSARGASHSRLQAAARSAGGTDERQSRNPKRHWTTRHCAASVGIDSGFCPSAGAPGFGIYTRRRQRTIPALLQLVEQPYCGRLPRPPGQR